MKVIRCFFFAIVAFICLVAATIATIRHPTVSVAFEAPDRKVGGTSVKGLTIAVQKAPIPRSLSWKKHRRVVVCDGPVFCTSEYLIADFSRKLNLYRHQDGSIVLTNDIWMIELQAGPEVRVFGSQEEKAAQLRDPGWDCGIIGPLAEVGFPAPLYFRDMEFIGAFYMTGSQPRAMDGFVYRGAKFLPSAMHGEDLCSYPSRS